MYKEEEFFGKKDKIIKNQKIQLPGIAKPHSQKIIISPGPRRPEDSGISNQVVQKFYTQIPILGVCLGHECIAQIFGSKITHSKKILHGKTSDIHHAETKLFKDVKNQFKGARYHSLIVDTVPKNFTLSAWTDGNEIMAIQHDKYPLYGVQFHPESFLTEEGEKLMHNFLYEK